MSPCHPQAKTPLERRGVEHSRCQTNSQLTPSVSCSPSQNTGGCFQSKQWRPADCCYCCCCALSKRCSLKRARMPERLRCECEELTEERPAVASASVCYTEDDGLQDSERQQYSTQESSVTSKHRYLASSSASAVLQTKPTQAIKAHQINHGCRQNKYAT